MISAAMDRWQKLAGLLKTDDPDDRRWYLLALRRDEGSSIKIKDRRQVRVKLLEDAEIAFRSGRPNEAITIKSKLFDDYSRYKDLADLFPATPANVSGSPATSTSPQLDAASPVQAAPPTASGSDATPTAPPPADSGEPATKSKSKTPSPES